MTLDVKRYPILVVDDEQVNLDAFRFNFRKTFDILTATSGPEALGILAEKDVAWEGRGTFRSFLFGIARLFSALAAPWITLRVFDNLEAAVDYITAMTESRS